MMMVTQVVCLRRYRFNCIYFVKTSFWQAMFVNIFGQFFMYQKGVK